MSFGSTEIELVPLHQLVVDAKSIAYGVLKPGPNDPTGVALIRIKDLAAGTIDESELHYITRDLHKKFKRTELIGGEVLVSIQGTVGRVAIVPNSLAGANISRTLAVVRPKAPPLAKWLLYGLQSPQTTRQINGAVTGSTRDSLNLADLRRIEVPYAEQTDRERIVAEIEKQFSRLDEAVANLKRVKASLKRYKAAVLKAAAEGRLVQTEAELASRDGRDYESGEVLLSRLLDARLTQSRGRGPRVEATGARLNSTSLPGWTWACVEQLSPAERPCAYGVLQPGDDVDGGVPFVRVGDIDDGNVNTEGMKAISSTIAAAYPRTQLHGGEVLITLVGAIGRTAVVPERLAGANVARAVGVIPLRPEVDSRWVEIWFRNPVKVAEMDRRSHEVARKTLNLEDVRSAMVAIPPLAEQKRIVAEVDRRLSIVREVQAEVEANLKRAQALRQATLARAFGA